MNLPVDGFGSLGLISGAELTHAQIHCLKQLGAYDLSQLRHRLRVKALLPEPLIDPALLEYRRFLALHVLLPASPTMFSPPVDEVWHAAIMSTHRYSELCQRVAGGLIHHSPNLRHEFAGGPCKPDVQARFLEFREQYQQYFGTISPLWTYDRPWAQEDQAEM